MTRQASPAGASARRMPGELAANLDQALRARHMSARGLSLSLGLSGDTCRNIISGRSVSPRAETVEALARGLGVSIDALRGREPLPPPPLLGAPPAAAVPDGMEHVPEVEFDAGPLLPVKAASLTRRELRTWTLPEDALPARGGRRAALVIVQAEEDAGGVRRGDKLFIDASDGTPAPGVFLLWDGWGAVIARCSMTRRAEGHFMKVEHGGGSAELRLDVDVEIIGRVVGRLTHV